MARNLKNTETPSPFLFRTSLLANPLLNAQIRTIDATKLAVVYADTHLLDCSLVGCSCPTETSTTAKLSRTVSHVVKSDKLKILQINTVCGYGSTGRTCTELAKKLEEQGHECTIAYGQGETSYDKAYKIGTKMENHLHNVRSRLFGRQGYHTKHGTENLVRYIQELQPDVIHLRNLHGNYLNLKILFDFLAESDTPIVWTLHDCWAYTGKCAHYTVVDCYRWQTHCHDCPQYKKYPPSFFFDFSEAIHADKKRWFGSVNNMTLVPVSHWLAGEVQQSFLGKYPIIPIYNWIDQEVFKPNDPAVALNVRKQYGIPEETFVILGVSAGWSNCKGSSTESKLHDFAQLSKMLPDDMQVVLVGEAKSPSCIPEHVLHIPYLHDTKELASVYSMADVYVHLSMEDTFGKVIAEALACGTPAVVYDSTACPEVVGQGCGYIAERRNIDQVIESLLKIQKAGKQTYSSRCVAFSNAHFNYKINTDQYLDLYKRVLSE